MKSQKKLVLASKSPRRKELMEQIGLEFEVHPGDFEEKDTHLNPEDLTVHNALGKAQAVVPHHKNSLIIGVDTVGAYKDHIIGKPKDDQDAKRMLNILSNTTHKVVSGIAIIDSDSKKAISAAVTTLITMDELEPDFIDAYIKSGEGRDKAASYAIQGRGALFIREIKGDYFNVVGLPIYQMKRILQEFNYKFY